MEPKGKEITVSERKIITDLWKEGNSFREIGKLVKRTHSSIQRVVNNFKQTRLLTSKPRSGRPSKLSCRERRDIIKTIKKNPRTTASQIAKNIEIKFNKKICPDTVQKILKKEGYHSRVARRKPLISEINRLKRIKFANEHINKPNQFWEKVIFSDESKFCIFGIKGRNIIWRKTGTAINKENLIPTVKQGGGGVMVWGCMASRGVGQLQFIESTMTKEDYLNILKQNLKRSAEKLGLHDEYIFQHDNEPKHTAWIVKLWLLYNVPKQLHTPPTIARFKSHRTSMGFPRT